NERIVGAIEIEGRARNYDYTLRTLHTDKGTYDIGNAIPLSSIQNADHTASQARASKLKIASQVASDVLSLASPIIVLASSPNQTYEIAEKLYESVENDIERDEDVELVIKLIQS